MACTGYKVQLIIWKWEKRNKVKDCYIKNMSSKNVPFSVAQLEVWKFKVEGKAMDSLADTQFSLEGFVEKMYTLE